MRRETPPHPAGTEAAGAEVQRLEGHDGTLRGARSGAQESVGFWADVIGAFGRWPGAYPEVLASST